MLVSWRQAGVRFADRFRGEQSRIIATPGVKSHGNGVAVTRDGSTLLVSDCGGSHAIHEFRVADGSRLRVIGKKGFLGRRGAGDGPLQFSDPRQVWVASDDHVFVADCGNNRVQVLTPRLDFHAFVGVGQLETPEGVCANDAVVVVSDGNYNAHRISVFNRGDGALLRRFGSYGSGDGELKWPRTLCFMSGHRHIAVAESDGDRVSVFSVEGEFVRHVGVGVLSGPHGVACSAFDELVVSDFGNIVLRRRFADGSSQSDCNPRVVVFSASGELLKTMGRDDSPPDIRGVAIHGGTIFAQDYSNAKCILFK